MSKKRIVKNWEKFWRLSIIKEVEPNNMRQRIFKCECICWNIKDIKLMHLVNWNIKSCWCISKKHWMAHTRFYHIFKWLNQRCKNPRTQDYKLYWWRWIKCEWNDFISFRDDMYGLYVKQSEIHWEENISIDRINSNWNYSKENCKWSIQSEQVYNRRNTIQYKWKSLSEWCRILDIKYITARDRIKNRGKTIEEVLGL